MNFQSFTRKRRTRNSGAAGVEQSTAVAKVCLSPRSGFDPEEKGSTAAISSLTSDRLPPSTHMTPPKKIASALAPDKVTTPEQRRQRLTRSHNE